MIYSLSTPTGDAHMNEAAALIREVSPSLASLWASKPFHRKAVVRTLYDVMRAKAESDEDYNRACRVRILLLRQIDLNPLGV
jgi:hypothetical protein